MKNAKSIRMLGFYFQSIKRLISFYKKQIIICSCILLLGLIIGVITVATNSGKVGFDNIFDKNLAFMLNGTRSAMSVFMWSILNFSLIIISIIFLNKKKWMFIFTAISLFILGFHLGYNFVIMIVLFGFTGFLNVIIIFVPFDIVLTILIILLAAIYLKRNLVVSKFGCNYYNRNICKNHNQIVITILIIFIVILFIKSLFMPIIKITIIIND